MLIVLTILHILICFFLIIVVLLQSGKAADLAGAFGGMGSQTAFGPRGSATLLSKATTGAAVLFMLNSIALGVLHTRAAGTGQSVIERTGGVTETVPLTPVEQPATTPAPDAGATETPAPETTPPAGETAPAAPQP
ncbi:MAG: preprotein translocase subunit SecG [Bryobacterales bacterium]